MQDVETMVKTYKSSGDFTKDAKKLAKKGWTVTTQSTIQPRSGIGRIVATGGLGAIAFKPKPEIVVTFTRPKK